MGGYQPHDAEEVLEKRYGDCKDMVVLICALAARADIRVLPVMISTHQNGLPDTSLPSPLQFNHLIAYAPDIDSAGIWLDATEKNCRFGHVALVRPGGLCRGSDRKGRDRIAAHPALAPVGEWIAYGLEGLGRFDWLDDPPWNEPAHGRRGNRGPARTPFDVADRPEGMVRGFPRRKDPGCQCGHAHDHRH